MSTTYSMLTRDVRRMLEPLSLLLSYVFWGVCSLVPTRRHDPTVGVVDSNPYRVKGPSEGVFGCPLYVLWESQSNFCWTCWYILLRCSSSCFRCTTTPTFSTVKPSLLRPSKGTWYTVNLPSRFTRLLLFPSVSRPFTSTGNSLYPNLTYPGDCIPKKSCFRPYPLGRYDSRLKRVSDTMSNL